MKLGNIGFVLALILLVATCYWFFSQEKSPTNSPPVENQASNKSKSSGASPTPRKTGAEAITKLKIDVGMPGLTAAPDKNVQVLFASTLRAFRESQSEEESLAILKRLRDVLRSAPDEAGAAAAILAFFKSGEDATTGLPFLVGPDGMMELVPTMRTALLDMLPSLDPLASVDLARQIMDQRTSQDEYALGLRNLAWNDFEGDMRTELQGRFTEMLDTNDWLASPSAGFLEAFDVAVELGGGRSFDDLSSVLLLETTAGEPLENGVTRASLIALDRIMLREPAVIVEKFNENPAVLDHAPQHRAALMSRLDLNDPAQRDTFLKYLQKPDHGLGELEYFSNLFPNGNYFYGNRLVTADEVTPSLVERQEMDRNTLTQVNQILLSIGAGPARDSLQTIQTRLVEFTSPPSTNPSNGTPGQPNQRTTGSSNPPPPDAP